MEACAARPTRPGGTVANGGLVDDNAAPMPDFIVRLGGIPAGGVGWLYYLSQAMALSLLILAIFRFGLLVTFVMILVDNIPSAVPIIAHGPSWATTPGNLSIALVLAIACFGFYAARAGQPLFGRLEV